MRLRFVTAVAVLAAIVFAMPAIRHWQERPPAPPPQAQPVRSTWIPPGGQDPGAGAEYVFGLSIAPNGRQLVYPSAKAGVVSLWLHDLRTGDTRELPGTTGAVTPFWSADGLRIGFFAGGGVRGFALSTGQTFDLAPAASSRGAAWNLPGDLVFAPGANTALMRRDAGGSIAPFTTLDAASGETSHAWPAFLPGGRHVIFLVAAAQSSRAGIWIAPLDDPSSRRRLMAGDSQAIVVDDVLLYVRDSALMAHRLDRESFEPVGGTTVVGLNAGRGPLGQLLATASSDVLIYGAPGTTLRQVKWFTRQGAAADSPSEPIDAWDLRIAPDGRRVAITEVDRQLRTLDVFIRTSSLRAATRLSPSIDLDDSGVWSPDGLRIAWAGQRRKVMLRGAGAVLPEQTIATFDTAVQVWDWSRDGRSLLIGRKHHDTGDDLSIQPPVEGATAQPYVTAPFNQTFGVFSPDGRAVAYASDESGQVDVYVDGFPRPGSRKRVTTAGGTEPRWSHDGRELFFRRGSEIFAAVLSGPEVKSITRLFDAGATVRSYDSARNGQFLLNLPANSHVPSAMTLIHHWRRPSGHGDTESRSMNN